MEGDVLGWSWCGVEVTDVSNRGLLRIDREEMAGGDRATD